MTVLVGYIPSAEGEAALWTGIAESLRRAEPLVVVNASRGRAAAGARLATEGDIDRVARVLADSGVEHEVRLLLGVAGDAARELVDLAASLPASVIVIGLRRRTATGPPTMGATAQRVLLEASCPVLTVTRSPAPLEHLGKGAPAAVEAAGDHSSSSHQPSRADACR
ncbi:universal stress protein [Nonomuraea sp. NPDC050790]|uniref:universal stress protein n=1 Tax=Nonomuraea sp. NPDC050790 TaxID=3364371 RepID=UPI00379A1746